MRNLLGGFNMISLATVFVRHLASNVIENTGTGSYGQTMGSVDTHSSEDLAGMGTVGSRRGWLDNLNICHLGG